ncbi:MAG TPA: hypothetical protein VF669_04745 [Tepidisphaeraceae bacterium]|jgi:DNA-binding MarR family transcriptional regulator
MRTVTNYVLEHAHREVPDNQQRLKAALKRAALLPEQDRLLIELVLRNTPKRRIAELLKRTPGNVCRRIDKLCRRLYDPVVISLMNEKCPLPADLRQMGVERLLLGMNCKEIGQKHGMGPREVKKRLEFLTAWHQGLGAAKRLWETVY